MNAKDSPYKPPTTNDDDAPVSQENPKSEGSVTWGVIGILIGCLCTFGSIRGFAMNGAGAGTGGLLLNLAFGTFYAVQRSRQLKALFQWQESKQRLTAIRTSDAIGAEATWAFSRLYSKSSRSPIKPFTQWF